MTGARRQTSSPPCSRRHSLRCSKALHRLPELQPVGVSIPGEFEEEPAIVTTVGQVIDLAGDEIAVGSGHTAAVNELGRPSIAREYGRSKSSARPIWNDNEIDKRFRPNHLLRSDPESQVRPRIDSSRSSSQPRQQWRGFLLLLMIHGLAEWRRFLSCASFWLLASIQPCTDVQSACYSLAAVADRLAAVSVTVRNSETFKGLRIFALRSSRPW